MLRGAVRKSALQIHFQAPLQLSKMGLDYQRIIFQGKKGSQSLQYGQARGASDPPPLTVSLTVRLTFFLRLP